ncbi:hypothetical protein [Billgrantia kenyensis]|uniref:Uncharacterized protein n=1 Tax=Billgrantia kenyensis TaxID=321266 RepID=A0A7V9VXK5_9GAMM|nr:hypothetical protein [Halomonas kenyensis]MBA2777285.1 hypothetical protein [Halomonas kenyensis]MCG6659955.1 hypothetical protein [Halomonas kenyensis]
MTTSEGQFDRAAQMRDFLAGLAMPFSLEQSAKCRPGRWSRQRYLFSTPVDALGPDRLARELPRLLASLGMGEGDAAAFLDGMQLPSGGLAHYLHLGVEDGRPKAYWEASQPPTLGPGERFVLYRAWKWWPGEEAAVSDYVLVPTAGEARQAIQALLADLPMAMTDLLEQLEVSFALSQTPWPPLTVRIEERRGESPTPRHSLNLHLYGARLPLGAFAGLVMGLKREWSSAPRQATVDWVAAHGDELLSNLSFGYGEDGKPFLTCYHGTRLCRPAASEE